MPLKTAKTPHSPVELSSTPPRVFSTDLSFSIPITFAKTTSYSQPTFCFLSTPVSDWAISGGILKKSSHREFSVKSAVVRSISAGYHHCPPHSHIPLTIACFEIHF